MHDWYDGSKNDQRRTSWNDKAPSLSPLPRTSPKLCHELVGARVTSCYHATKGVVRSDAEEKLMRGGSYILARDTKKELFVNLLIYAGSGYPPSSFCTLVHCHNRSNVVGSSKNRFMSLLIVLLDAYPIYFTPKA